jgi:hypothetical protein
VAADSRADADAGGTRCRPIPRSEVTHSEGHRDIDLPGSQVFLPPHSRANSSRGRGNAAPESAFPPPFLRFCKFCRRPEERELASELDVRPVSDSPRTTNHFPDRALKPDAASVLRAGLPLGVTLAQHSP